MILEARWFAGDRLIALIQFTSLKAPNKKKFFTCIINVCF